MKRKIVEANGRQFEVKVDYEFGVFISLYEVVHPTWKIFRTKFFDFTHRHFFIEDIESIDEAIQITLKKGLEKEAVENANRQKIEEYERNLRK